MSESEDVLAPKPLPKWPTYIGYCCREWVMAAGVPVGTCGLCGERPVYHREDS